MEAFISIRGLLILLVTTVVILITLKKPHIGLIYLIIVISLERSLLRDQFKAAYTVLHLPQTIGLVTFFSWFISKDKYKGIVKPLQLWAMIFLLIVMSISTVDAGDGLFSNLSLFRFFRSLVIFFLAINIVNTEAKLKQVLWTLVLVNTLLALDGFYNYKFEGDELALPSGMEIGGKGSFASLLVFTVPIAYALFWIEKERYKKVFLGFAISVLAGTTLLSFSRAAMIALGLAFMMITLVDIRKKERRLIMIPLVLCLAIYVPFRLHGVWNRLETVENYEEDGSAMSRITQVKAAINMMKAHPLLGVGPGHFNAIYVNYLYNEDHASPGKSIHNTPAQIGCEAGLGAFFLFLLLLGRTFMDPLKVRRICGKDENKKNLKELGLALGISLLTLFFHSLFVPNAYDIALYLLVSLVVAAKLIALKEVKSSEEANKWKKGSVKPGMTLAP